VKHPGRLALVTVAAFDPRLTDRQRATNLRIALPNGYDPQAADQHLREARAAREQGHGTRAQQILEHLISDPPMQEK
jgi:hypothetical protein